MRTFQHTTLYCMRTLHHSTILHEDISSYSTLVYDDIPPHNPISRGHYTLEAGAMLYAHMSINNWANVHSRTRVHSQTHKRLLNESMYETHTQRYKKYLRHTSDDEPGRLSSGTRCCQTPSCSRFPPNIATCLSATTRQTCRPLHNE